MNGIIDSNQKIVTSGLRLSLDAAQLRSYPTTGTTWTDLSGNGFNGTLTNGPTFNSANGGSIIFDGTNDYASFTPINMSGTQISFTAFVKPNGFGTGNNINSIVRKGDVSSVTTPSNYVFALRDSRIAMGVQNAVDSDTPAGNTTLTANQWYYLAASWNGTSISFYVNGGSDGNVALSSIILEDGRSTFVGGRTGSLDIFNGNIASVQMYNRALSATEVGQNYNAVKSRFGL